MPRVLDETQNVAKGPWSEHEDNVLRRLVAQAHEEGIERNNMWVIVGNRMAERNGKQCRERWVNHLDPSIKKGSWTKEEEQLLDSLHKK